MVLTDWPYGVSWEGRGQQGFGPIANDCAGDAFPVLDVLRAALRALRSGRHVYCFGARSFGDLPIAATTELVWDKGIQGLGDLSLPWGPSHETILFGVYVPSKANRKDGQGGLSARLRRGSVLRCDRLNSRAVVNHPTEKPVSILRQMIESSSLFGETVLDPFAGSGSTLVAAKLEGRKSIGIEIDERYCETAAKRLSQQRLPLESVA
ncbi:MAG TPA: site-specific DNA-methyltransferase [Chloroflexota bacterium]|nr:site-specific DNA-methyltransferase [Chloroflexota bacterium]